MKLNLLERTVTCCLVGAATIAIASGLKRTDPPEGDGVCVVNSADEPAIEHNFARIVSVQRDGREGGDDATEQEMDKLVKAVQESTGSDKEGKRIELKEVLTKVFRERTEAQRSRIEAMKERLGTIDSQLDRRSKLEEQIVMRRLGELLGDRDELSWDHEPALESLEFAERHRESQEPTELALEYTFAFPKEYPTFGDNTAFAEQARTWGNRLQLQREKKLADEKSADASKSAREAQNSAAKAQLQWRVEMDRVRAAKEERDANLQEVRGRLDRDRKKMEQQLPYLQRLRGALLEVPIRDSVPDTVVDYDNDGYSDIIVKKYGPVREAEALRAELSAVRAQSESLKKQLDELTKQKSEGSKQLQRP